VDSTYIGGTDVNERSETHLRLVVSSHEDVREGQTAPWAISPSDIAFLWDDCPRCFYRKVARRQPRPRSPFPSVFGKIDRAMKEHYLGERSEIVAEGMPPGIVGGGDRWVKSAPLLPPGGATTCVIRGRVDVLIDCDDGTKGIVDFKTTLPKADHLAIYGRQLHAYAMALEHPAGGRSETVSSLGLLCFLPDSFEAEQGTAGLFGPVQWVEVPRDDEAFVLFLAEVVSVLDQDDPPPADPSCPWCGLRDGVRASA
jgi:PD-(D/E)XK nuclease superfamily